MALKCLMQEGNMIKRYTRPEVEEIWLEKRKTELWQLTELAVIQAKVKLGRLPGQIGQQICEILSQTPIDLEYWHEKEAEIKHDLEAFLEERRRHLPAELQIHIHADDMTSFDTEESPFVGMLRDSVEVVDAAYMALAEVIKGLAQKYRYTLMMGRTHGQEAELQTFGKRCLAWFADLSVAREARGKI